MIILCGFRQWISVYIFLTWTCTTSFTQNLYSCQDSPTEEYQQKSTCPQIINDTDKYENGIDLQNPHFDNKHTEDDNVNVNNEETPNHVNTTVIYLAGYDDEILKLKSDIQKHGHGHEIEIYFYLYKDFKYYCLGHVCTDFDVLKQYILNYTHFYCLDYTSLKNASCWHNLGVSNILDNYAEYAQIIQEYGKNDRNLMETNSNINSITILHPHKVGDKYEFNLPKENDVKGKDILVNMYEMKDKKSDTFVTNQAGFFGNLQKEPAVSDQKYINHDVFQNQNKFYSVYGSANKPIHGHINSQLIEALNISPIENIRDMQINTLDNHKYLTDESGIMDIQANQFASINEPEISYQKEKSEGQIESKDPTFKNNGESILIHSHQATDPYEKHNFINNQPSDTNEHKKEAERYKYEYFIDNGMAQIFRKTPEITKKIYDTNKNINLAEEPIPINLNKQDICYHDDSKAMNYYIATKSNNENDLNAQINAENSDKLKDQNEIIFDANKSYLNNHIHNITQNLHKDKINKFTMGDLKDHKHKTILNIPEHALKDLAIKQEQTIAPGIRQGIAIFEVNNVTDYKQNDIQNIPDTIQNNVENKYFAFTKQKNNILPFFNAKTENQEPIINVHGQSSTNDLPNNLKSRLPDIQNFQVISYINPTNIAGTKLYQKKEEPFKINYIEKKSVKSNLNYKETPPHYKPFTLNTPYKNDLNTLSNRPDSLSNQPVFTNQELPEKCALNQEKKYKPLDKNEYKKEKEGYKYEYFIDNGQQIWQETPEITIKINDINENIKLEKEPNPIYYDGSKSINYIPTKSNNENILNTQINAGNYNKVLNPKEIMFNAKKSYIKDYILNITPNLYKDKINQFTIGDLKGHKQKTILNIPEIKHKNTKIDNNVDKHALKDPAMKQQKLIASGFLQGNTIYEFVNNLTDYKEKGIKTIREATQTNDKNKHFLFAKQKNNILPFLNAKIENQEPIKYVYSQSSKNDVPKDHKSQLPYTQNYEVVSDIDKYPTNIAGTKLYKEKEEKKNMMKILHKNDFNIITDNLSNRHVFTNRELPEKSGFIKTLNQGNKIKLEPNMFPKQTPTPYKITLNTPPQNPAMVNSPNYFEKSSLGHLDANNNNIITNIILPSQFCSNSASGQDTINKSDLPSQISQQHYTKDVKPMENLKQNIFNIYNSEPLQIDAKPLKDALINDRLIGIKNNLKPYNNWKLVVEKSNPLSLTTPGSNPQIKQSHAKDEITQINPGSQKYSVTYHPYPIDNLYTSKSNVNPFEVDTNDNYYQQYLTYPTFTQIPYKDHRQKENSHTQTEAIQNYLNISPKDKTEIPVAPDYSLSRFNKENIFLTNKPPYEWKFPQVNKVVLIDPSVHVNPDSEFPLHNNKPTTLVNSLKYRPKLKTTYNDRNNLSSLKNKGMYDIPDACTYKKIEFIDGNSGKVGKVEDIDNIDNINVNTKNFSQQILTKNENDTPKKERQKENIVSGDSNSFGIELLSSIKPSKIGDVDNRYLILNNYSPKISENRTILPFNHLYKVKEKIEVSNDTQPQIYLQKLLPTSQSLTNKINQTNNFRLTQQAPPDMKLDYFPLINNDINKIYSTIPLSTYLSAQESFVPSKYVSILNRSQKHLPHYGQGMVVETWPQRISSGPKPEINFVNEPISTADLKTPLIKPVMRQITPNYANRKGGTTNLKRIDTSPLPLYYLAAHDHKPYQETSTIAPPLQEQTKLTRKLVTPLSYKLYEENTTTRPQKPITLYKALENPSFDIDSTHLTSDIHPTSSAFKASQNAQPQIYLQKLLPTSQSSTNKTNPTNNSRLNKQKTVNMKLDYFPIINNNNMNKIYSTFPSSDYLSAQESSSAPSKYDSILFKTQKHLPHYNPLYNVASDGKLGICSLNPTQKTLGNQYLLKTDLETWPQRTSSGPKSSINFVNMPMSIVDLETPLIKPVIGQITPKYANRKLDNNFKRIDVSPLPLYNLAAHNSHKPYQGTSIIVPSLQEQTKLTRTLVTPLSYKFHDQTKTTSTTSPQEPITLNTVLENSSFDIDSTPLTSNVQPTSSAFATLLRPSQLINLQPTVSPSPLPPLVTNPRSISINYFFANPLSASMSTSQLEQPPSINQPITYQSSIIPYSSILAPITSIPSSTSSETKFVTPPCSPNYFYTPQININKNNLPSYIPSNSSSQQDKQLNLLSSEQASLTSQTLNRPYSKLKTPHNNIYFRPETKAHLSSYGMNSIKPEEEFSLLQKPSDFPSKTIVAQLQNATIESKLPPSSLKANPTDDSTHTLAQNKDSIIPYNQPMANLIFPQIPSKQSKIFKYPDYFSFSPTVFVPKHDTPFNLIPKVQATFNPEQIPMKTNVPTESPNTLFQLISSLKSPILSYAPLISSNNIYESTLPLQIKTSKLKSGNKYSYNAPNMSMNEVSLQNATPELNQKSSMGIDLPINAKPKSLLNSLWPQNVVNFPQQIEYTAVKPNDANYAPKYNVNIDSELPITNRNYITTPQSSILSGTSKLLYCLPMSTTPKLSNSKISKNPKSEIFQKTSSSSNYFPLYPLTTSPLAPPTSHSPPICSKIPNIIPFESYLTNTAASIKLNANKLTSNTAPNPFMTQIDKFTPVTIATEKLTNPIPNNLVNYIQENQSAVNDGDGNNLKKYLKHLIPYNEDKIEELANRIETEKEVSVPLNTIGIAKYEPFKINNKFNIKTDNPGIKIQAWTSKLKIIKPQIIFNTYEVGSINFIPIVKDINEYNYNTIVDIVKKAVVKYYGEPIVLKGVYSFYKPYALCDINEGIIKRGIAYLIWPTFCNCGCYKSGCRCKNVKPCQNY